METETIAAGTNNFLVPNATIIVESVIFVAILLNGLLLGRGGFLTAKPTPSPVPEVTASPSASAYSSTNRSARESRGDGGRTSGALTPGTLTDGSQEAPCST